MNAQEALLKSIIYAFIKYKNDNIVGVDKSNHVDAKTFAKEFYPLYSQNITSDIYSLEEKMKIGEEYLIWNLSVESSFNIKIN